MIETGNQRSDSIQHILESGSGWEPQDGNPRKFGRVEKQGIAEVKIQGNKRSPFAAAGKNEISVRSRTHALTGDGLDVVTGLPQEIGAPPPNILVQLDLQRSLSSGSST